MVARRNRTAPIGQIIFLLAIPLIIYFSYSIVRKSLDGYSLSQEADAIRRDIEVLKNRNFELKRQADYLSTDGYIEKVAREELNLVKPGEISVVVVASPALATASRDGDGANEKRDNRPNWNQWWDYFQDGR